MFKLSFFTQTFVFLKKLFTFFSFCAIINQGSTAFSTERERMANMRERTLKIVISALLLALALVMPYLTGQIPESYLARRIPISK